MCCSQVLLIEVRVVADLDSAYGNSSDGWMVTRCFYTKSSEELSTGCAFFIGIYRCKCIIKRTWRKNLDRTIDMLRYFVSYINQMVDISNVKTEQLKKNDPVFSSRTSACSEITTAGRLFTGNRPL